MQNSCIYIQESAYENVVCKVASILFRLRYGKTDGLPRE